MNWLYLVGYVLIGIIFAIGIVALSYRKKAPLDDDAFAVIAIVLLWPIILLAAILLAIGNYIIHIGEKSTSCGGNVNENHRR